MNVAPPEAVKLHGLRFDLAGISEQGPRSENQDALSLEEFARTGLVAVADGMGGERSGRVAADTALRSLLAGEPIRSLDAARRAVRAADAAVAEAAEADPAERGGMGCALGLLALAPAVGTGPGWIGAHVGDVRILSRAPDGTIRLETRDHTPAFARWAAGEIALDQIPETPGANRLQRAVGRGGEADTTWLPARPGWSWLVISDGIYKAMRLDELGEALAAPTAAAACEAIRRKVEERGPDDNYTALLVRALGGEPPAMEETTLVPTTPTPPAQPRQPARRSAAGVVIALLALVALVAAGFALWTARQAQERAAERATELQLLRTELDSLRVQVIELSEPFGPTASPLPDTTPTSPSNRVNRP